MLKSPGAVAFHIGSLTVYWYGIIISAAFLAGLFITLKIAEKDSGDSAAKDHIIDMSTFLLIGGIIAARLYYVIFNWSYYSIHLPEILMSWKGGLSIHGAVIAGLIIVYLYTKRHGLSFLKYTDFLAYGLIFAQAIGRWGNFFNSEAFGIPTNLPWKMYIPVVNRPHEYINFEYFHPTFLYESLWNIAVFVFMITIIRKYFKGNEGAATFFYLIMYSLGRFLIEGIRVDNIYSVFGLHIAQFISIIMFIAGVIGFCKTIAQKNRL